MRNITKSVTIALGVSLLLLSCSKTEHPKQNLLAEQKPIDGKSMNVQIVDDGNQFTIKNVGEQSIEALSITTYPPPLSNNILQVAYSFSKDLGTLEKGNIITVKRDELKNDKTALLSNSKRKVGAIRIGGKVSSQPYGIMFTLQDSKWIPSPPDTKWAATEGLFLGAVDKP